MPIKSKANVASFSQSVYIKPKCDECIWTEYSFIGFVLGFHSIEKLRATDTEKKSCSNTTEQGKCAAREPRCSGKTRQKVLERGKNTGKIPYMVRFEFLRQFFCSEQQRAASDMSNSEKRACGRVVFNGYAFRKLINESLIVLLYSSNKRILY